MLFYKSDGKFDLLHDKIYSPFHADELFEEHFHTDFELIYYIHGNAIFYLEQNQFEMKERQLLLIFPGEHHYIDVHDGTYYERIVIHFNEKALSESLKPHLRDLNHIYDIRNTELEKILFSIDRYISLTPEDLILEFLQSTVQQIIILMCGLPKLTYLPIRSSNNVDLNNLIAYINQNLEKIQSLDDISFATHMSKSTITRLFKQYMFVSVMSYVRAKKCIMANRLIEEGASPLLASQRAGFKEYSTFYRNYIHIFHHSPANGLTTE